MPRDQVTLTADDLGVALDRDGYAVLPGLLDAKQCTDLAALYDDREAFRSRVKPRCDGSRNSRVLR